MEPGDLWEKRLDRKLRDRAPKVVENPTDQGPRYLFTVEGAQPFPVAGTLGMSIFATPNAELQQASFDVYNDWLAEYCRYDSRRLYGTGLISLEDVDQAVSRVAQLQQQGMRGLMIWGAAPADRPYSERSYDPFWAAAAEAEMPVSLHIIASRGKLSSPYGEGNGGPALHPAVWYSVVISEIQESLSTLIFGGVLERFPGLRIVSAENDVGWLPHFAYRMDHAYDKFNAMWSDPLPMRPSEYMRRQIWATFQDDPIGPATHEFFGADNYMWASDFPHSDSTFPESHAFIERNFAGVPDEVRKHIVYDNAVRLYGMDLD
jgi:predicted TIM-barrel fold metal-dependent hydrolase